MVLATGADVSHEAISSYFIGPRAENLGEFRDNITAVLDELQIAREQYFKEDVVNGYEFIPQNVRDSAEFKRTTAKVARAVRQTARLLGQHSIPFWSPRYQAHMCTDLTMPSMLGYLMAMMYNPNNVAIEASPLSTVAEIEVGEQLCEMFGFQNNPSNPGEPTAWGHVTSGGTVANLESLWVARNLKFYPLSMRKAMDDPDGPLRIIPASFSVRTCDERLKPFRSLTTWELLNLKPKTILDLASQLHTEFGITPEYLQQALDAYNIQTLGKDTLERHFSISDKPAQFFVSSTRHYSWPKAAAILGIGSANAVSVPVDHHARVDLARLEAMLEQNLAAQQPVYSVVAVIGTTEEGAVDQLHSILALRQKFQAKGMSFLVHADAAWGGYFATMLPRELTPMEEAQAGSMEGREGEVDGIVPDLPLRPETQEALFALRYCDSITIDPHKSGYIPYPAGALAYRDGRIKNLVTWTAPVLSRGSVTSIGIFGVEGSKPGAAALAIWLSNQCIGLDQQGYGALLSEACFTSARLSALWAALARPDDSFTCVPFNPLPSEATGNAQLVEDEKQRIRDEILTKSNFDIVQHDQSRAPADKTITLLRALGSDLNINAFALNWRRADGSLNTDVHEANYLMTRVVQRLSVDSPHDKPTDIPLYLTSTEFEHDLYGDCVANYKRRLGLAESDEPLMVLRNVVMSPLATFSTRGDFINMLGETFKRVVEEEVRICQARNEVTADYHSFWTRGKDSIFLSYQPMFHLARHRHQIILAVEFDEDGAAAYRQLKGHTEDELEVKTADKIDLAGLLAQEKPVFKGNLTTKSNGVIHPNITITVTRILKNRPLHTAAHDPSYPLSSMPFYLYGTPTELHIDHVLVRSPNIVLSASNITLALFPDTENEDVNGDTTDDDGDNEDETPKLLASPHLASAISAGAILTLETVPEAAMQPFTPSPAITNTSNPKPFFFHPRVQFHRIKIWSDPRPPTASPRGLVHEATDNTSTSTSTTPLTDGSDGKELEIGDAVVPLATGGLALGGDVVVDVEKVNRDPFAVGEDERVGRWREVFKGIGRGLEEDV